MGGILSKLGREFSKNPNLIDLAIKRDFKIDDTGFFFGDHRIKNKKIFELYKKFGTDIFRRSSIICGFEKVITDIFHNNKMKTALEIGTYNGITAAILTDYFEKVITIDIFDEKIKYKIVEYLGLERDIEFKLVNSEIEKENFINSINFDFAYIDGNHFTYTYSDWMMTRKCGRCLFHEYNPDQKAVYDLISSLPQKEVKFFQEYGKHLNFAYWNNKGS